MLEAQYLKHEKHTSNISYECLQKLMLSNITARPIPFYSCIRNLTARQRQLVEELAKEERGKNDKGGFSDKEEEAAASAWGWTH